MSFAAVCRHMCIVFWNSHFYQISHLSLSHLTKETFNSLNAEQEPYAYCYPEGLFLTIPDKTDISDYPSDLKKLIQYAWDHKISLIHMDRDAELFLELPIYQWND